MSLRTWRINGKVIINIGALKMSIVQEPVFVVGMPYSPDKLNPDKALVMDDMLDSAIRFHDLLAGNGVNVRMLGINNKDTPDQNEYSERLETMLEGGVVVTENVEGQGIRMHYWPRDFFFTMDDTIHYRNDNVKRGFFRMTKMNVTLNSLGVDIKNGKFENSVLAEQGLFVYDGKTIAVSDFYDLNQAAIKFSDQGYKVVAIPMPADSEELISQRRERAVTNDRPATHIDSEFNFVQTPGGNIVGIVDRQYLETFSEDVDYAVRELDAFMQISDEPYAPNFAHLGNGKVLMPLNTPKAQEFLKRNLGRENILVDTTNFMKYAGYGGSIRCKTNLIM